MHTVVVVAHSNLWKAHDLLNTSFEKDTIVIVNGALLSVSRTLSCTVLLIDGKTPLECLQAACYHSILMDLTGSIDVIMHPRAFPSPKLGVSNSSRMTIVSRYAMGTSATQFLQTFGDIDTLCARNLAASEDQHTLPNFANLSLSTFDVDNRDMGRSWEQLSFPSIVFQRVRPGDVTAMLDAAHRIVNYPFDYSSYPCLRVSPLTSSLKTALLTSILSTCPVDVITLHADSSDEEEGMPADATTTNLPVKQQMDPPPVIEPSVIEGEDRLSQDHPWSRIALEDPPATADAQCRLEDCRRHHHCPQDLPRPSYLPPSSPSDPSTLEISAADTVDLENFQGFPSGPKPTPETSNRCFHRRPLRSPQKLPSALAPASRRGCVIL